MSETIKGVPNLPDDALMGDRSEKITFTCTTDTREYLNKWSNYEGRSISNLVERIILKAIADREAELDQAKDERQ